MGTCEEVKPGTTGVLEGTVPVAFLGFGVDFLVLVHIRERRTKNA
jgi:hypothetical protein